MAIKNFTLSYGVLSDDELTQDHAKRCISIHNGLLGRPAKPDHVRNKILNANSRSWLPSTDIIPGKRVIIVGAGPGLDGQWLKLISMAKSGNYTIICSDRAALLCHARAVAPNIYFSIEASPLIDGFLDGIDTTSKALVCPFRVSPGIIRAFGGRVYHYVGYTHNTPESDAQMSNDTGCPILYEHEHVCGAAYVWAVKSGAEEVHFFGNDYYTRGYERYSQIFKQYEYICTRYYAKPLDNPEKIIRKSDAKNLILSVQGAPVALNTYPRAITPGNRKRPGKWIDGYFRLYKWEISVAMRRHPAKVVFHDK